MNASKGTAYRYYRLVGVPNPPPEMRQESTDETQSVYQSATSVEASDPTQRFDVPPNALGLQAVEFYGRVQSVVTREDVRNLDSST